MPLLVWLLLGGCGHSEPNAVVASGVVYTCPMHPDIRDDHAGTCPSCGMALVAQAPPRPEGAVYTCPMHPDIRDDHAGTCPSCGMALVAAKAPAAAQVVVISTERQQLIGVRTSVVSEVPLTKALVAAGTLASDETRIVEVPTPVGGVIVQVLGNPIGQQVRRGEGLLVIADPDVPDAKTTVRATATGHISWRASTVGSRIAAKQNIATIYDHAGIWVWVNLFESDITWVKRGQAATMRVPAYPGHTFDGKVTQVAPLLDPTTHTMQVRIDFPNTDFRLKPGMSAVLEIQAEIGPRLVLPEAAVIRTGAENVVFVDQGDGRFEVRDVALGLLVGDQYEIVSGLVAGERIVSAANFLVDSESRLQGIRTSWGGETPR